MRSFLVIVGFVLFVNKAYAIPKTCVISLIAPHEFQVPLQEQASLLLRAMEYENPQELFTYSEKTADLLKCLSGPYEEILIFAHSASMITGHYALLYPQPRENGDGVYAVFNDRIFKRAKISPTLRQITLSACHAEEVLKNYPSLQNLLKQNNVKLRLQKGSITAALLTGDLDLRTENLFSALIAESAQTGKVDTIYCLLQTSLLGVYESGTTECMRNRFRVSMHAPLSFGLKNSTSWVKIRVDGDLQILSAELGFLQGIKLSGSRTPFDLTKESFGVSISLGNYFSVEEVKRPPPLTKEQRSPLLSAARAGKLEEVDTLLKHGADVNEVNDFGQNALMIAIWQGHMEVAKRILQEPKLDLTTKDVDGFTARQTAKLTQHALSGL